MTFMFFLYHWHAVHDILMILDSLIMAPECMYTPLPGQAAEWSVFMVSSGRIAVVAGMWYWGYFRIVSSYSNAMGSSLYSHSSYSEVIAMKFCTWYDCCAVVECAKFFRDMVPYIGVTLIQNSPSKFNYDREIVHEMVPCLAGDNLFLTVRWLLNG